MMHSVDIGMPLFRKEKRMIKGLIFDLDGVLVDTAKYHYLAWKEIAMELGIDFTEKDNERLKGISRSRSMEILLEIGNRCMEMAEQEAYCTKKNKRYVEFISAMQEDEVLPGVKEFLTQAKAKGYRIALGSASKNSGLILDRLHLRDYFDVIIDGTKVEKAKPDPEVFVRGAMELGVACEECIVFEDSEAGIEAAHRGHMKTVGIGCRENLPEADIVIKNLKEYSVEEIV